MAANIDWDTLKSALKNNKCVLFIGQDFHQTDEGKTLDDMLGRFLNHAHADLKPIYDQDGFLPLSKRNRNKAVTKVVTFFEDIALDFQDLYKTITLISFRVVVNMTPDESLIEVFKAAGIPPIVDYYNQNDASAPKFDPMQPFIFNFSGKLRDEDSLVLTHADFYNHLKSKFAEQSLNRLRNALLDVRCAVFMGVPYNRYFMDLLLRTLRMHEADSVEKYWVTFENEKIGTPYNRYFMDLLLQTLKEDEAEALKKYWLTFGDAEKGLRKSYLNDAFNITFIKQNPVDFFKELIENCGASVLRTSERLDKQVQTPPTVKPTFNAPNLQKLLGDGKDEKVLMDLEAFFAFEDEPSLKELSDQLILLKSEWSKNKLNAHKGLISLRDAAIEENRIVRTLQTLITETAEEYQKIKTAREQ